MQTVKIMKLGMDHIHFDSGYPIYIGKDSTVLELCIVVKFTIPL